jgi:hypothetical protein
MSHAQQAKRVRKRLCKTRPPKGKSQAARTKSAAIELRLKTKGKK